MDKSYPQSGVGGAIPNPKKLKPASVIIASAIFIDKSTIVEGRTLGKTYFDKITGGFAPMALAPSTYNSDLIVAT